MNGIAALRSINLRGKHLFLLLLLGLAAYWVWGTDTFQELAFPRAYWTKQAQGHRFTVEMFAKSAASCRLELAEFERTTDLKLQKESLNRAPGVRYPETPVETVRRKYQQIVERCRFTEELFNGSRQALETALSELRKAGGAI
jgi:hypothetical protein